MEAQTGVGLNDFFIGLHESKSSTLTRVISVMLYFHLVAKLGIYVLVRYLIQLFASEVMPSGIRIGLDVNAFSVWQFIMILIHF